MTMITIQAPADDFLTAFARRAAEVFRAWNRRRLARGAKIVAAWDESAARAASACERVDDLRASLNALGCSSYAVQRDAWSRGASHGERNWLR